MTSPFKFLDSYTREDREIFFGRAMEIEELYRKVFESKILLVYGISGTGKSSLIDCGLANKFQESDWLPIPVRRGGNVVESFSAAVRQTATSAINFPVDTPKQFLKAIRSIYLDQYKPIYFIFDQFEELFIFGSAQERKALALVIKSIIESDLQCRFIISMREEYLAGITEFEKIIPSFYANRMRIEKMSLLNAQQAIEGPCKVQNIQMEEGFANALLERLSPESTEVELTYLQVALDKLYRGAQKQNNETLVFNKDLLKEVGNVSDLLGSFLEEQVNHLNDPETVLTVLKSLVSVKGTKKQMTSDEINDYTRTIGKPVEESVLPGILQDFVHLRILRDKDMNERYELRHDALATKIFEKFTAIEKDIIEVKQFIENALFVYEKREKLLTADDLKYIAPYEDKLILNNQSDAFINRSKSELLRSRKRRMTFVIAAIVAAFIVLSGFTIWAMNERKKSVREKEIAEIQKENAIFANNKAVKAEEKALLEKKRAMENEIAAIKAKEEAELSKETAFKAEAHAFQEKNQAIIDRTKATNALKAKIAAEKKLAETSKDFVLSAEKMNILYKGIKNPISFAIPGLPDSCTVKIYMDQDAQLMGEQGKHSIIPYSTGIINFTLFLIKHSDSINIGTRSFMVKNLPSPVPYVDGRNSGFILRDSLTNIDGIQVLTPDADFNIPYRILQYKVTGITGAYSKVSFIGWVNNNNISDQLREQFHKLKHNDKVSFEDIKVIGPDSLFRNIGSVNLKVVEWIPYDDPAFFRDQVDDLIIQQDWEGLVSLAVGIMDKYYMDSPYILNYVAYNFYLYINDNSALNKALLWAERAVKLSKEDPGVMDTYACLLFKLGQLDEAAEIENKAIMKLKAHGHSTEIYEDLLKKIHNSR